MAKDRPGLLGMPGQLRVQGGLPIQVEGDWVGAVGVSGVASHEDEQVARAGITALG
jgi:glc operon protein GlcG